MGLFSALFGGKKPVIVKKDTPGKRASTEGRDDSAYFKGLYLQNFPEYEIRTGVPAASLSRGARADALPVAFLFCRDGVPKLAVLLMEPSDYGKAFTRATERACKQADGGSIRFVRFFRGWRNDAEYVVGRTREAL